MSFPLDDLAQLVGVMAPDEIAQEPAEDPSVVAARERYNRAGERLMALSFGLVVGTGLVWCSVAGLL
ncbi:hypothetical protein YH66_09785 [[Brevibacterium] flavum]|uniref:Uncharacterized protein n=1 Tax=[Brevibacterium] flavum TaxID=92706 RepID=A0A0F6SRE5_9CORY|nr:MULTISPECIES: hypothetical protein [Corynebacterium]AKF27819.1 hypothetical protein YH66_09785 [[Brevibacterium] flavum]AST21066.1 hypothetical protein CEY17_09925 [Corynebacterium glutamicum ATCC 14067]KEI23575.1 hypothetical protein KIQ_013705 [Corynebacterium glutamicum ATCC 14067]KIH73321.1 hypothetical protein SD36_09815 [Corynebacterium glutamicum]OKX96047.1 hypothetical protein AUP71_01800 [Corynebacterium glutamicum]